MLDFKWFSSNNAYILLYVCIKATYKEFSYLSKFLLYYTICLVLQSPNGVKFGGFDVYDEKSLTSLTITSRPTNCGKQQKRHQIWHPDRLFGIGQNYALFRMYAEWTISFGPLFKSETPWEASQKIWATLYTQKNCGVKRELYHLFSLPPIVLKSSYILKLHQKVLFSMEQNYQMF